MNSQQLAYLVFGIVLVLALIFDLGLLSKKSKTVSLKTALFQTVFWIVLALAFFGFLWWEDGHVVAVEYLSAYLMEWSLSIDNIFVFILIFSFFGVKEQYYARALLIGILMAIILRIIFISVGIVLIDKFYWILYIFGAILVFTGISMFFAKHEEEPDLSKNKVYKLLTRLLPIEHSDAGGKFFIRKDGKRFVTNMFMVIIMLSTTDVIFALDSIPAVFAISQNHLVIYTSNIFAVLGLRSLFFLLKGAVNKFAHLQQGIAIVLVFIGVKMLIEFFHIKISVVISLLVILVCLIASIIYSVMVADKEEVTKTGPAEDLH
jgi:tellurite resistance protein TerC